MPFSKSLQCSSSVSLYHGRSFVETFSNSIQTSDFKSAKTSLRFLSELALAHVIKSTELVSFYELLLSPLDDADLNVRKCDAFVYLILISIPFVGSLLQNEATVDFTKMLSRISVFIKSRSGLKESAGVTLALSGLSVYRSANLSYDQVDVYL